MRSTAHLLEDALRVSRRKRGHNTMGMVGDVNGWAVVQRPWAVRTPPDHLCLLLRWIRGELHSQHGLCHRPHVWDLSILFDWQGPAHYKLSFSIDTLKLVVIWQDLSFKSLLLIVTTLIALCKSIGHENFFFLSLLEHLAVLVHEVHIEKHLLLSESFLLSLFTKVNKALFWNCIRVIRKVVLAIWEALRTLLIVIVEFWV